MNGINDEIVWFGLWCMKNHFSNRINNAITKNMIMQRITIDQLLTMTEDEFVGWPGFGEKSRIIFMKEMAPKLKEDWNNVKGGDYIHEYSEYKVL